MSTLEKCLGLLHKVKHVSSNLQLPFLEEMETQGDAHTGGEEYETGGAREWEQACTRGSTPSSPCWKHLSWVSVGQSTNDGAINKSG